MKEIDVRYVLSKIAFKAQVIIEIKLIHDFEAFLGYIQAGVTIMF